MTAEQLARLNALVTFAAEHIPGGLSDDERAVARIVGRWALRGRESVGLRIVSDGTVHGTNVFTDEGDRLERVTRVAWEIDARDGDRYAKAHIEVHGIEIDGVLREGDFTIDPRAKIAPAEGADEHGDH